MLEEFGGKKRTRKAWTSFRSKTAKREAFKSGGASLEWRMVRKNKNIQNKRKWWRRLLGKKFSFRLENTTCSFPRASRRSQQKKKR